MRYLNKQVFKMSVSENECDQEPEIKKTKYDTKKNCVQDFYDWRLQRGETGISDQICLEYFQEFAQRKSLAVLNYTFYALKYEMKLKYGIDLGEYVQLKAFIHQKANEYAQSTKNKKVMLMDEHIKTFIKEAPDHFHLLDKVVIIITMMTKCTATELLDISWKDVHKHSDQLLLVDLPKNTKMKRAIVIRGEIMKIVQKYRELRPKDARTDKFFLAYDKGRCKKVCMGIHKFRAVIKEVASYLKLPNPELYSFWSFPRCASAKMSALFDNNPDCSVNSDKTQNVTTQKERENSQGLAEEAIKTKHQISVNDNINEADEGNNFSFGENTAPDKDDAKIHIRIDNKTIQLRPSAKYWTQTTSYENENGDFQSSEPSSSANDATRNRFSESEFDINDTNVSMNQYVNNTNISQQNKTVKLIFKNCKDVSNITINL